MTPVVHQKCPDIRWSRFHTIYAPATALMQLNAMCNAPKLKEPISAKSNFLGSVKVPPRRTTIMKPPLFKDFSHQLNQPSICGHLYYWLKTDRRERRTRALKIQCHCFFFD